MLAQTLCVSLIVTFVSVSMGCASLRHSCFQAEERPRVTLLLTSGPCWSGSEDSWFSSGLPTFSSGRLTAACETTWCWNQKSGSSRFALKQHWEGHDWKECRWTWVWVTPAVGDGQGGQASCSPWGHKESDTSEWLNWTEGREDNVICGQDSLRLH